MKIITSSLSKKVTSLNRIQKTETQWYRDHPFQNHCKQGNEFLYVKLEVIVKELAFLKPHRNKNAHLKNCPIILINFLKKMIYSLRIIQFGQISHTSKNI
jgi:hypothetical protein